MENAIFCCGGLSRAINNAGDSGFSALIKMSRYSKTFFFVQQYRNKDNDDKTGILTTGEVGIKFCPWCGCDLDIFINDNFELIKETYEKNKEFLLEF
ncbi:hypothetical protein [Chryseobacterium carnipullorum]|uniref:hypothetical protein n=1 Tax=Chryseobacterium carnipullorum TaxID=1124835 RepID=UPI000E95126E|nr:hypothetical protein [Chryseobacterium carnipullorum]HBV14805.1 hypothetical protein [Chryseobacterium carnipullorum]